MERFFLVFGSSLGLLAVAAGAFGAHALRDRMDPAFLEVFETAARYQMYHALALIAVAILMSRSTGNPWLAAAGLLFVAGTLVFSGSLYVLTLTGLRWLGAITPLGGVCLLLGWGSLLWAALRSNLRT